MGNRLEDLEIYNLSQIFGEQIWELVIKWDYLAKDAIGKQLVRSADSIAANISEGFGRFHYKENKNFCYFSLGSILETKTGLQKDKSRKLIEEEHYQLLMKQLELIHLKLNAYIKFIGKNILNDQ
ncbi:four helix bundle protein [Mucilaginibacter sp. OK283]|jgi:four helix bundle protein|uniref:four helix bundle protein n=1 Tax=Mucilaginibacter sp. OK283 TaxID=1881049 RepID=UPI0008BC2AA9|nr:four helix bundle protein [Mucilaginibacter sp. OK283]SEP38851.1 four helix bundle protein [Mucilaginibacter sp. OK283]